MRLTTASEMLSSSLQGKSIPNSNIPAIRDFLVELKNIHELAIETNRSAGFDQRAVHDEVLEKLPQWKSKWWEKRSKMGVKDVNKITFTSLMEFLRQRLRFLEESTPLSASFTKTVVDAATSGAKPKMVEDTSTNSSTNSSSSRRSRGRKFSPRRATSPQSTEVKEVRGDPEPCVVCTQVHYIENCQQFKNLSATDRADVSRRSGLCFTCLERGHTSRSCASKRKCGSCGGKHHGLLHEWMAATPIDGRLQANAAI